MILLPRILATAGLVLALAAPAQARLGETLEQVTERYGQPIVILSKAYCGESEGGSYLFRKDAQQRNADGNLISEKTFRIQVEFKNGKAWFIRYHASAMTDADRQDLLANNAGDGLWSNELLGSIDRRKRVFWKDIKGKSRYASCHRSTGISVLEAVDADCMKAMAKQRRQELAAVADMADWAPMVEPGEPTPAPAAPKPRPAPAPAPAGSGLRGL